MTIYSLVTSALLIAYISFFQQAQAQSVPRLFNENNIPHQSLTALLDGLNIKHTNTLESIVQETQKEWLRKPGTERWHEQKNFSSQSHTLIIKECSSLGMIGAITPKQKKYDYIIVLGGTVQTTRKRFAYALELINQNVSCNSIVFLCGQRPLDKTIESEEILVNDITNPLHQRADWQKPAILPTTETEMAHMIIDQTELPKNIKEKIVVIDTPSKIGPNGNIVRPTTGDTFAQWLSFGVQPGTVLVISSQPYVGYQDSVSRTFLPKTFIIETVGKASQDDVSDAIMLDTLTRWIYQSKQLLAA